MAAADRAFVINPFNDQYSDDNTTKALVLHADGLSVENPDDRHSLLRWTIGTDLDGNCYIQIIHLSGGPGNYQFHIPQDALRAILTAEHIPRSWTIDDVVVMVNGGLLPAEIFDKIDADIPLKKAVPELPEDVA
ncbi:hypothetical protein EDD17DRAFT_1771025 [Pisolithus thermaeus]|nr:hypothetical protein EDD17DRAFT_1771025 [Pisolithus thermaeus]